MEPVRSGTEFSSRPLPVFLRAFVFLCALLLAGGSAARPPGQISLPADMADRTVPQHLSAKDRREIFEKTWREIRDHYYDPSFNGADWNEIRGRYQPQAEAPQSDSDFYALMSQVTSELHDAHTRFSSPQQWRNYKRQRATTIGFSAGDLDGRTVITSVQPGSNAARAGIEPGMFVVSVNGEPIASAIAKIEKSKLPSSSERATRWFTYSRLFGGPPNSQVTVGFQRADGSTFERAIALQAYSDAPSISAYRLSSGNAYIRFDGFQRPIVKDFKDALEKFRNAPGLIIDLRSNGGGDLSVLLSIAGYFFDKKTLFAKDSTRSGKPLSEFAGLFKLPLNLYVGKRGGRIYSGPVVILVSTHSASSAEVFAAGMQDTRRAKIIGTQSCGCVLGIARPRQMKGGGVLEVSEVLWFTLKGRKLEGTGIIPDQTVFLTVADVRRQHDAMLAQADKALTQWMVSDSKP